MACGMERGIHVARCRQSADRMECPGSARECHCGYLLDQCPQSYRDPGKHRVAVRDHELGGTRMRIIIEDSQPRESQPLVSSVSAGNGTAAAMIDGGSAPVSLDNVASTPSSNGVLT